MHTCAIQTLAYGGDGIARIDGRVVFVPGTIPGETVRIRITQTKKNFARGEAVEILEPSPERIDPCCRVGADARVPGCVYDHLAYAAEVQAKQQQVEGFFRRIPHAEDAFLPPVASPAPLHYRNKTALHAEATPEGFCLGYRQEPSHRVLDLPACPLADPSINDALNAFRASADARQLLDPGGGIVFRTTPHDGAVWYSGDTRSPNCPDHLTAQSPAGPMSVPHDGFWQVNPAVADALVRFVMDTFAQDAAAQDILDLYCGVGVLGLACMKRGGRRLAGIESGRAAVAAARQNAKAHGVEGRFTARALGRDAVRLNEWMGAPCQTTIIADPPREGMGKSVVQGIAASGAARIFYISCDPATLTRDLTLLLAISRYRVHRIRLFDMFPRTAHVETFVELQRMAT
ncbi:MAG: TRAM domain-containing protein [Kiritimatiellaeota bacterium]|nr:TRAM domain-containing protein [Kiritimatiellota bacterium]